MTSVVAAAAFDVLATEVAVTVRGVVVAASCGASAGFGDVTDAACFPAVWAAAAFPAGAVVARNVATTCGALVGVGDV